MARRALKRSCDCQTVDDEGNVFVSGYTAGRLGEKSFGGFDVFVSKFNADGTEIWTQQIGSNRDDHSFGITVDQDGDIFVAGDSGGDLGFMQTFW